MIFLYSIRIWKENIENSLASEYFFIYNYNARIFFEFLTLKDI